MCKLIEICIEIQLHRAQNHVTAMTLSSCRQLSHAQVIDYYAAKAVKIAADKAQEDVASQIGQAL